MRFHRLWSINRKQRGFTLIELMLAIAISGIITGGITTTIFQVVIGSARTNNHMTAVRHVQEAGYFVSRDVQMAQIVQLTPAPDPDGFPLTLTWTDWGSSEVHQVTYTLEDIPDSDLTNLQRSYSHGATETSIIAQFIDPTEKDGEPQTKCDFTDGKLTFTVTATVGGQSETRVYEIVPRPGS